MVNIVRRRGWEIPESEATPEAVFRDRRAFLAGLGKAALGGALLSGGLAPRPARAKGEAGPAADLYPAPRNEAFTLDREVTPEDLNLKFNNFYEFGSQKEIFAEAQALKTSPWDIEIDGLVEAPFTIGFEDLVRKVSLEERLYRHRCVEAWAMAVPWTGFPLSALVALAKPLSSAKYLRFETFMEPEMATGQKQIWYPWPYVEGVTIEEAGNDLAFLVTGAYGKPVAKQMGAPIRLALPWKYGFKSIKSIRKITFTDTQPKSFWEEIAPHEYGFWANVNPGVSHPRWPQHQEQMLGSGLYRNTEMFNGYGDQVASLYSGMEGQRIYY